MTITYTKPADITPDVTECRHQIHFKPPEIEAQDDAATSSGAQAEVYTESAVTGAGGWTASASPAAASFVYLDVGLWAGSDQWAKARDFGLIHGPIVMLCTFSTQTSIDELDPQEKKTWKDLAADVGPSSGVKDEEGAIDYSGNLLELITHLSKGKLGDVWVRQQIISKTAPPTAKRPDGASAVEPIYVILGDMHIPLADKVDAGSVGDRVGRHGRIDMKPLQDLINDLIPASASNPLERVKALLGWAVKLSADPTAKKAANHDWWGLALQFAPEVLGAIADPLLASAWLGAKLAGKAVAATPTVAEIVRVAKMVWTDRDERGVVDDKMNWADAQSWFQFYRKRPDGKKPADISENACADFLEFVNLLDKSNQRSRIQFMQLGDMIDYWIGFSTYFSPTANGDPYVSVEPNTAIAVLTRDQIKRKVQAYKDHVAWYAQVALIAAGTDPFINPTPTYPPEPPDPDTVPVTETLPPNRCIDNLHHWTDNLFKNTDHGKLLLQALTKLAALPLEPIYLSGNHDNYLGSITVGTALSKIVAPGTAANASGPRNPFPQRLAKWAGDGIWMEHGHQCDTSNGNNVDVVPGTQLVVGTDSTLGEFLTQAAFLRPEEMRTFEGTASGAMHDIKKNLNQPAGFGQRFDQIAYAINLHDTTSPFRIYVMGHTHRPVLLDVNITNKPRVGPQSAANKVYAAGGTVTASNVNSPNTDSDQYEGVTFTYDKFPDDAAGHINLEEPWGPQKKPMKAYPRNHIGPSKVKPLVIPVSGKTGSATFDAVPPGALLPRYYLGTDNDVFVWTGAPIFFPGLSFDTGQSMFGPNQSIPLRWCTDGTRFPAPQIFFEVFGVTKMSDGTPSTKFCGQQLALAANIEGDYAHGRTTFQRSGAIVTRIAELCKQQLDNRDSLNMLVEPGGKALLPSFYILMFATKNKVVTIDEGARTPAVAADDRDTFKANNPGTFSCTLWLRMRVPIPSS